MIRIQLLALLAAGSIQAGEFYVAPTGSDTAPGTKERPFATLEAARDAVSAHPGGPSTVWVGGGNYVTRDSIQFTAKDSGTQSAPVRYRALPGEKPVISAGVIVPPDALKPVMDPAIRARLRPEAADRIRQVDLGALGIKPNVFKDNFRTFDMLDLSVDGKRLPISRWPNGSAFTTIQEVSDNGVNPAHGGSFVYRDMDPERWIAALQDEGVWIRGFWRVPWVIESVRVESIDPATKTIKMAAPIGGGIGSKYKRDKSGIGKGEGTEPWHALNLLEEIDQPGEWSVNFKTNTLYLWPPDGGGPLLVSDARKPVLSFEGADHIGLEGLVVQGGLGAGIGIKNGEGITVAGCHIQTVGDHGVLISGGKNHRVLSCDIQETGQAGIRFTGGDRRTLTPGGHSIINNLVTRIGVFFPAPGIVAGEGVSSETVGNLVAHNRIHDVPSAGIVFAGNDNVMEFNEIYRIGLGSGDLGAFYTNSGWTARGNIIRDNFVHHSMNANAFYMDDGSCGSLIENNVVFRAASGGFIGGGHDQTLRNNAIIECLIGMHVDSRGVSRNYNADDRRLRGDLDSVPFQSPPWSERYPELVHILDTKPELPSGILIERNLIVSCPKPTRFPTKPDEAAGITFKDNFESEDLSMFVDPANFDFALKPDAPVFAALPGFKAIPFANIGLYADSYRPEVPARDMELLRNGSTELRFDSQKDIDASNRK